MNLSELEKRYKDFLAGQESQTQNQKDIDEVWGRVQDRVSTPLLHNPIWYLAAASVTLLLLSTFAFIQVNQKNKTILSLQAELEQTRSEQVMLEQTNLNLSEELVTVKNTPAEVDTVYLTQVVYKPARIERAELLENINSQGNMEDQSMDNPISDNLTAGIESLEIEYGETSEAGITPWKFKIKYE